MCPNLPAVKTNPVAVAKYPCLVVAVGCDKQIPKLGITYGAYTVTIYDTTRDLRWCAESAVKFDQHLSRQASRKPEQPDIQDLTGPTAAAPTTDEPSSTPRNIQYSQSCGILSTFLESYAAAEVG
ncbi:hypothetical protein ACMFMG_001507 [Clarireedia jacksonii]